MKIEILAVQGHGDQKVEVATFKVLADCDIGRYALFDSSYTAQGSCSNKVRHTYWFPDGPVKAGDYVFLHTGVGQATQIRNTQGTMNHHYYWGLGIPVWNDKGDFATLIEISTYKSKKVA